MFSILFSLVLVVGGVWLLISVAKGINKEMNPDAK